MSDINETAETINRIFDTVEKALPVVTVDRLADQAVTFYLDTHRHFKVSVETEDIKPATATNPPVGVEDARVQAVLNNLGYNAVIQWPDGFYKASAFVTAAYNAMSAVRNAKAASALPRGSLLSIKGSLQCTGLGEEVAFESIHSFNEEQTLRVMVTCWEPVSPF